MNNTLTCPMCGHTFDPAQNVACAACPLQSGCQVVCCPACGFETVDPSRSRLAQLASRLFRLKQDSQAGRQPAASKVQP